MKKSSIILVALTLILCFAFGACDADNGKVKDTTQGMDMTTTQNITTVNETTRMTDALTDAITDASDLLTPTTAGGITATP